MYEIQELARLYALFGKKNFDLFRDEKVGHTANRLRRLYEGVASGKITNDESACKELYGSISKVPVSTYNSVKMRLFRRLMESMFFLDPKKNFVNRRSYIRQECITNVAAIRILLLYGAYYSIDYIALKTLKIAREYQLTFAAKESALALTYVYAYSGRKKEYAKFSALTTELIEAEAAEDIATMQLQKVTAWYAANWSLQQENLAEIALIKSELDVSRKKHNTAALHEAYFLICKIYFEVQQDYEQIIELFKATSNYYEQNPLVKNGAVFASIAISALYAHVWLSQYDEAFALATLIESQIKKGRASWFVFQEAHFLLSLRSKNYLLARSIFVEVISHPQFRRDDSALLEKWRLMEFYVRFIGGDQIRVSLLPPELLKSKGKNSHFRAFSATVGSISKDLQGFNIVAVFAQILYLIRIRDFDSLIQRDESLQTLTRKRLSKLNYRLSVFARMIHAIVECEFEVKKIERKVQPLLHKLKNVPDKFRGGSAETLEIIPLEDLWEMMMRELASKRGR